MVSTLATLAVRCVTILRDHSNQMRSWHISGPRDLADLPHEPGGRLERDADVTDIHGALREGVDAAGTTVLVRIAVLASAAAAACVDRSAYRPRDVREPGRATAVTVIEAAALAAAAMSWPASNAPATPAIRVISPSVLPV